MNRCVVPGTFDPMHSGHVSVVQRAAKIFDEVVVAVAQSQSKSPKHSHEDRVRIARDLCSHIDNVVVEPFDGLLVDFVKSKNAKCVVKGLRNVDDFQDEISMATINKRLSNDFETLFLMSDPDKLDISSTRIRELESLGIDPNSLNL